MVVLANPLDTAKMDERGEPMVMFRSVEEGFYVVMIVGETGIVPNKKGNGSGYHLIFELQNSNGQKITEIRDYYAFTHVNNEFLARCENKIRRIGQVVNVPRIMDTKELYYKPFVAYIGVDNSSGKGYNVFVPGNFNTEILPLESADHIVTSEPAPVPQQTTDTIPNVHNPNPTKYPRRNSAIADTPF